MNFHFRYVVKISHKATPITKDVKQMFGDDIKMIFATRLPKQMIKSWIKVVAENNRPDINHHWISLLALPYDEEFDNIFQSFVRRMYDFDISELVAANFAANMICELSLNVKFLKKELE